MKVNKKLLLGLAGLLAAPLAAPALGGLLGMGGAAAAGAGGTAGALGEGLLPALLPEATLPAMLPIDSMLPLGTETAPYLPGMPGTSPDMIISGLEAGRQGALEPDMMQLVRRGLAGMKNAMGDDKLFFASRLMQGGGGGRTQPQFSLGQRPPPMPFEMTARLTPEEKRRYFSARSFLE